MKPKKNNVLLKLALLMLATAFALQFLLVSCELSDLKKSCPQVRSSKKKAARVYYREDKPILVEIDK